MHFQKYIDYITAKFYSNSRYTSSFFSTIKFFFEKNNKYLNTVDKLGNVYRSSKWVDLKLRNLNASSLLRLFFFLFLFTITLIIIIKLDSSFYITLFAAPLKIIFYIIDTLYYSWLLLVALAYAIIAKVRDAILFCALKALTIKKQSAESNSTPKEHRISRQTALPLRGLPSNVHTQFLLPAVVHFYKLQKALIYIERSLFNFIGSSTKQPLFVKMISGALRSQSYPNFTALNLYKETISFLEDPAYKLPLNTPYIMDTEALFCEEDVNKSPNFFKNSYSFSPYQGVFALFTVSSERNLLSNITINLTLSKENRWLWKSNMFSNNLVEPLNSISQTKKYINNPLFSNSPLNRNLWVSAKVSDSSDLQLLNSADQSLLSSGELATSRGGKGAYANLNFMEDSVLWSLNRFTNYQNMQAMQHVTSNFGNGTSLLSGFSKENSTAINSNLALVDYHFILSKLYPTGITGVTLYAQNRLTTSHLGGGSESLLLNHPTLSLLEVYFASTANKANKVIFFSNI